MRLGLLLASAAAIAACNMSATAQRNDGAEAASSETRRTYDVGSFDAVKLAGPHQLIVTAGAGHSVTAEGDQDILDHLKIEVENGTLKIGQKEGRWSWNNRKPAVIRVAAPSLKAAALAGSGDIRIDRVQGDSFAGSIAGSGDLDVQSLDVGKASFSIAGSGDIRATGRAGRTEVNIAGSGDVGIDGLASTDAAVSIVGSGNAHVRAARSAEVSIMGSGDVRVAGGAKCTVNSRGSGRARCEG